MSGSIHKNQGATIEERASNLKLSIAGLRVYAHHGVFEEERKLGGKYEVDVDLMYNAAVAIAEDTLDAAVDYTDVAKLIEQEFKAQSYNLLESLADAVLHKILATFPDVDEATIRLRKMTVPHYQSIDFVQVEQHMRRSNNAES